jgi:hypothetical protein
MKTALYQSKEKSAEASLLFLSVSTVVMMVDFVTIRERKAAFADSRR